MKTAWAYTFIGIGRLSDTLEVLRVSLLTRRFCLFVSSIVIAFVMTSRQVNFLFSQPKSKSQRELSFQFDKALTAFSKRINLDKVKVLSYDELRDNLLKQVPYYLRTNMDNYLKLVFITAQKYQIDPFWVLAVMKTESHFNTKAVSRVGARGLMQVMPKTSLYIANRLKKLNYGPFKDEEFEEFYRPQVNIEMGVYYLGYLLKKFKYNPSYATMAYNMGPGRLRKKLQRGMGKNLKKKNNYLKKVKENYFKLLDPFRSQISSG